MSPFFITSSQNPPQSPSGQEDGTRGNPGKTAESRRAWGSVGRREGQGQGLELDMDKVRVGGDWGIGGFLGWWGWEFGWSSYGILIGEMWDGWID